MALSNRLALLTNAPKFACHADLRGQLNSAILSIANSISEGLLHAEADAMIEKSNVIGRDQAPPGDAQGATAQGWADKGLRPA